MAPTFVAASGASTNTANASVTINYPAGSANGDLLVMMAGFQRVPTSGSQTITTPSGWNVLHHKEPGVGMTSALYWRFRGAETSVTVTCNNSTNQRACGIIHAYTGDIDPTNPINASSYNYSSVTNTANPRTMPALTTTFNNCELSYFMNADKATSGTTSWSGATERYDAYSGTGGRLLHSSATDSQPTAGSVSVPTWTPSLNDTNESLNFSVAISPLQNATVYGTDDITLTENAYVQASVSDTDSVTLTESDATLRITADPDQITLSETAYVQATAPADDTITLSETAYVEADMFADDSITFSEDAYVSNSIQTTEDITLTEADSTLIISDNDAVTWSETAFIEAETYATEDISVSETAWVTITVDSDGITVTDDAKVGVSADDSISVTETAGIAVHVFATDGITVTEDAGLSVYADDDVTVTENAIRLISGLLQFPRQVKIPADNRRIIIDREPRRVSIDPDYRRTSIRAEERRHIVIPKDKRVFEIEGE